MRRILHAFAMIAALSACAAGQPAIAQTGPVVDGVAIPGGDAAIAVTSTVTGRTVRVPARIALCLSGGDYVPCASGGGGGGGGGDASATNQNTQITAANLTNTRLGDITSPATGSVNQRLNQLNLTLGTPFQAGGTIGNTAFGATQSGTWNLSNITGTISLPTGAATATGVAAVASALPAKDSNGDLRVPTVTVTAFYVSLSANTSTELLAASSTRIAVEIQCTGTAAVGISNVHATLTKAVPDGSGAGNVDAVIPQGTTPMYIPLYVSASGVTAYSTSAQQCWGKSYARQ